MKLLICVGNLPTNAAFNDKNRGALLARFFFDFRDGNRQTYDREGLDLENTERAKREAMVALTQVLQLEEGENDQRHLECRVRDGAGGEVYKVVLRYNGRWASDDEQYPKFEQARRTS